MSEHLPDLCKRPEAVLFFQTEGPFRAPGGEVVEVPLLLSRQQMIALETAAHHRGLTTGEMVRRLLQEVLPGSRTRSLPASARAEAFLGDPTEVRIDP